MVIKIPILVLKKIIIIVINITISIIFRGTYVTNINN